VRIVSLESVEVDDVAGIVQVRLVLDEPVDAALGGAIESAAVHGNGELSVDKDILTLRVEDPQAEDVLRWLLDPATTQHLTTQARSVNDRAEQLRRFVNDQLA
jgi:hypothetical protein